MSETKHTPGLLEANGNGLHAGTRCVATTHMEPPEQRRADATFIARAWNNHDKLIEACQGALLALYCTLQEMDNLCTALHLLPFPHPPTAEIEQIIRDAGGQVYTTPEQARTALADAEREQDQQDPGRADQPL